MKHSFQTRYRAFRIWQTLGFIPWRRAKEVSHKDGFSKGAFDSIPFLNEDAKRTFAHLLLRPGYMIRDYLNGQHERYLAPLTSLIIFYAFFALISSIINPNFNAVKAKTEGVSPAVFISQDDSLHLDPTRVKFVTFIAKYRHIFSLDLHPEDVDTTLKASIAAFEGALRSQGVYLFLGSFIVLWLAMAWTLRKKKITFSAAAAIAAYVLCQFCFFMLFSLFLPLGKRGEIGLWLMVILLVFDYCQLFEISIKKSLGLTIKTGVMYGVVYIFLIILVALIVAGGTYLIVK